ncbi:MAG: hypothetical protein ACYC7E_15310 [Armatimonadota bacterium]
MRALILATFFLLAVCLRPAIAVESACKIIPQETWSTVFGGEELSCHFQITSTTDRSVRASWVISTGGHAIARNEQTLVLSGGNTATLKVQATLPQVKDGVIAPADITVTITEENQEKPRATLQYALWIFPKDPFALRAKWLEGLKITLFDPEKHTAKLFDAAHIPYTLLANVEALPDVSEGMLIVGEGVSFDEYRGLMESLVRSAAGGRPVLCLAPAGGGFPLPGTEDNDWPAPNTMSFKRADVITTLDKRLDARTWAGGARVVASSLRLSAEGGIVRGKIQSNTTGWSWLEMGFPRPGSRMILCGFGLIDHWAAGPTPRFLFARILEYLVGDSTTVMATP